LEINGNGVKKMIKVHIVSGEERMMRLEEEEKGERVYKNNYNSIK
jgi:hypothetical protein